MKLTGIILLSALMQVSAAVYSQQVTLNQKGASLHHLLKEISKQTGYTLLFSDEIVDKGTPVTINMRAAPMVKVLDAIFANQQISYSIDDKTILIEEKKKTIFEKILSSFAAIDASGKVLNEQGIPIIGATVQEKNVNRITITDAQGNFTLKNVDEKAIIVVSVVGYETIERPARSAMGEIKMKMSISNLDAVQVIGYGTTTKRLNTGSVKTITADDIQHAQQISPIQALEGMVPGLFIQQSNGNPGAISKVMLRGTNSITSGTTPLYIVDGVPFDGLPTDRVGGGGTFMANVANGNTDPLNAINTADIESVDVLKDADATSIYGSRGANGVIIITTKKPKSGKMQAEGKVYSGASKITRMLTLLNTAEYIALRKQAFANDNITPTTANAPDLTQWSQTNDTDYQEYLIGNTAHSTDANVSLSQGNALNGFLLSGAYHHETTVLPTDFGYNRGSMHGRGYLSSPNGRLKVDFSTLYSADKNELPGGDFTSPATTFPGNYPLYNENGTLYFNSNIANNPLAYLRRNYSTEVQHLTLNGNIGYKVLDNLNLKINTGTDNISQKSTLLSPQSAQNPATATSANSAAQYTSSVTTTYYVEPQVDYSRQISNGKLAATLGGTYQYRKFDQPYFLVANTYASDALIGNLGAAANILARTAYTYLYKYASVFGRLNYNWNNKYILSGTFRRDGSSKFGPGKQFGNFASIGAAWLFTEESLLKDVKWLSFGKLRGSYGTVGNDQIRAFGYLDSYRVGTLAYGTSAVITPSGIANPDFSWETTKKLEVAIELGFLDNNLSVNTNWFQNRSNNLLANFPLSGQTGFTSYTANLDAVVQNSGLEMDVKAVAFNKRDFKWNVGFNISGSRNKLVAFPGLARTTYAGTYVIGKSLNIMSLYNLTGFVNGIAQIEDVNKDGRFSAGQNNVGDYVVAGTTDPKFYGGLSNNLKYKNFQLDVFINFTKQLGYAPTPFPGLVGNQPKDVLNSQFKPSTLATSASYTSYANYFVNSNGKVQDASYVRLRNITFSYNLPQNWLKAMKASSLRVFVTGQNLLTLTKYDGFDPETQAITQVGLPGTLPTQVAPPLKSLTAGIQFSF